MVINLTQGKQCYRLDGFLSDFYSVVCNMSVINIMNVEKIDMLQVEAAFNFAAILLSILLIAYCLLYTSPSPRDKRQSRMPSSA